MAGQWLVAVILWGGFQAIQVFDSDHGTGIKSASCDVLSGTKCWYICVKCRYFSV